MKERDIFEDAFRPFWACGGEGGLPGRATLPQKGEGDAHGAGAEEIPICSVKASGGGRENLMRTPESEITERPACGGSGRSCGRGLHGGW